MTWHWQWPVLSTGGTHAHRISSLTLWGYFVWVSIKKTIDMAGPRLRHIEASKFDRWPDLDPRLKLDFKVLSMIWKDLLKSFRTPLPGTRYYHWFSRWRGWVGSATPDGILVSPVFRASRCIEQLISRPDQARCSGSRVKLPGYTEKRRPGYFFSDPPEELYEQS